MDLIILLPLLLCPCLSKPIHTCWGRLSRDSLTQTLPYLCPLTRKDFKTWMFVDVPWFWKKSGRWGSSLTDMGIKNSTASTQSMHKCRKRLQYHHSFLRDARNETAYMLKLILSKWFVESLHIAVSGYDVAGTPNTKAATNKPTVGEGHYPLCQGSWKAHNNTSIQKQIWNMSCVIFLTGDTAYSVTK